MKPLSMNKISQAFNVDRATIYAWRRRGCPGLPAAGPGKPASLDFEAVLKWRLNDLAGYDYYGAEQLKIMATQARERLKEMKQQEKVGRRDPP